MHLPQLLKNFLLLLLFFFLPMNKYLMITNSCLAILLLLLLLSSLIAIPSCKAQNAVNIVSNAALCFNNMTVYRNCQQQFRLTPNGTLINMTSSNFSAIFCSGPCMTETQLLLRCVNTMFSNFQFFNGASIQMMGLALTMMCGSGGGGNSSAPTPQPEQDMMTAASEVINTSSSYSCHPDKHLWSINLLLFLTSICYYQLW